MLSRRAPLFWVGLALATGCLLGLAGGIPLRLALVGFALAGLFWWRAGRREEVSRAAFYLLAICAGLAHTLLISSTVAPDDLRRLPEEKTFPTTQWRGVVIEEPVAELTTHPSNRAENRTFFVLRMEAWRPTGGRFFDAAIDAPWQPAQGKVECTLIGPADEIRCGDVLETATSIVPMAAPLCPGELDERTFEGRQGIYYHATLGARNWRRVETGGGDFWQNLSYRARDWAYARLQIGLEDDPRIADFLAGMLLGYRQEIPADIEQDFRRTGTLHVFAVSGQNISELVVVGFVLLQLFGLVRWRWAWTVAPLALLYCLLTGSPASAVRATVMIMAVLLAWRLGRPLNALGCWSLALIAMLLWNPAILLDPGAQLSFGVVLGLILIAPRVQRILVAPLLPDPFLAKDLLTRAQQHEEKFWRYATALFGATIAATLVSEPITAIAFHQVTPVSVLANLIVVPMAGLITVVGTLGILFSLVSTTWAALLNNANWLFARLLIALVGFFAHEPGSSLNVPDLGAFAAPPPAFLVAPLQDSACLLVRTGCETWLFNTGRETPARNATYHLLQFYGINRLDGLVLMQLSVADNSGAAVIARDFHPRRLVLPEEHTRSPLEKTLPDLLRLSDRPPEIWSRGKSLDLGAGISVDVLNPPATGTPNREQDRALVLLFHSGGQTLLWAGKIDPPVQEELLAAYPALRADILVLDPDSKPRADWLRALGVRHWLQIPPRDRWLNLSGDVAVPCQTWDLDETGAVDIRLVPPRGARPAEILLWPWVSPPTE